jgi:hypothetical protein
LIVEESGWETPLAELLEEAEYEITRLRASSVFEETKERCAKVADEHALIICKTIADPIVREGPLRTAQSIASTIRALKEKTDV